MRVLREPSDGVLFGSSRALPGEGGAWLQGWGLRALAMYGSGHVRCTAERRSNAVRPSPQRHLQVPLLTS